jgi:predicted membrane channel-forming protein YqfA (hemolysin III family)
MTALGGASKTWLWPNAPRFLSALTYVAMGWSALPYLPLLSAAVDSRVVLLVSVALVLQSCCSHVLEGLRVASSVPCSHVRTCSSVLQRYVVSKSSAAVQVV